MPSPGGSDRIDANDRLGQRPAGDQLRLQIAELGARRQPAMPEQEADFFERRVTGEIVDVVAAVREHAAIAVEITDRRRGGDGVFEPGLGLGSAPWSSRYFPLATCVFSTTESPAYCWTIERRPV